MDSSAGYAGAGYYPSYEYGDSANQGNWLSSPALDPPVWPVDNEFNDGYANSPLPSPGICTPRDAGSQNYFDQSFSGALPPSSMTSGSSEMNIAGPTSYSQPEWDPIWTQGNVQSVPSDISLSLIQDPIAQLNDGENSLSESPLYSQSSSVTIAGESPPLPYKGTWGTTREPSSQRHSHPGSSRSRGHSSRNKGSRQSSLAKRSSTSGSSKGHHLRSTRTEHKISYSEHEEDSSTETTKSSRISHNKVEKQYRTRLNGQFSTLLEVLPQDLVGTEVESYGKEELGGGAKKISKAEVLVLARKHIENLERAKRGLEGKNGELMQDVQKLKGAWASMGGQILL